GESQQLLRPVPPARFRSLLEWYAERDIRTAVAAFKPAEAPALMLYPQGAELAHEAESSLQAGDIPGPLAGLVYDYIERRFQDRSELRGTLYLNASNPLIRRLAEQPPGEMTGCILTLIHQLARLFAGRMLSARDAVEAFGAVTRSLEGLSRP